MPDNVQRVGQSKFDLRKVMEEGGTIVPPSPSSAPEKKDSQPVRLSLKTKKIKMTKSWRMT